MATRVDPSPHAGEADDPIMRVAGDMMPDHPVIILAIDASRFRDIPGFYREINRVFMAVEEWQLGESLDALDDMLYGGYGALKGANSALLRWAGIEKSRGDLGTEATRQWLLRKLDQPERFNAAGIRSHLEALARGEGKSFFDIVVEIIESHPAISLAPA